METKLNLITRRAKEALLLTEVSDSEEPYAGKPHVRFCEGEPEQSMVKLVRHCQTKGAATDRFDLNRYPGSLLDHLLFSALQYIRHGV